MQLFELFGTVLIKDTGVESKLDSIDKKASGVSKGMGLSFGNIASAALKVGAVIGAGLGIKDMIDKASAGQLKLAQMDSVLKSTGGAAGMTKDELLKLADAQGKLTLFSKGANIETENLLLTFTNIGQKTFPDALSAVNDMSTALGQDTKSSAIQLGKALNDPIKGITALSRVGVSFTEEQKKQIEAMQKAGDTAGAQTIILKELQKEFGGSAEAAGKTFPGQLQILRNQISGISSQMGTVLIPYLTDFTTKINQYMPQIKQGITDAINFIVPKFKEWMKIVSQIVVELFPNFGKATDGVKGKVSLFSGAIDIVTLSLKFVRDNLGFVKASLEVLGVVWLLHRSYVLITNAVLVTHNALQLIKMLQDKGETLYLWLLIAAENAHKIAMMEGSLATKAITAAQWLFNAAMSANPIGVVVLALAGLGVAIYEVVKHWKEICTWIEKAWDWLKEWNGTKMESKTATTTLSSYTQQLTGVPKKASGDNNWIGGLVETQDGGGEILDLPRGTRIIPHDISMEMARASASNNKSTGMSLVLQITNFYNNRKEDLEELAQEFQFYIDQKNKGLGGTS